METYIAPKNSAAMRRSLAIIVALGMAAKKAMLTSMYTTETRIRARGAARLTVCIGFLISDML